MLASLSSRMIESSGLVAVTSTNASNSYTSQSSEALKGLRQIAVVEFTKPFNRLEGVVVASSRLKSLVIRNTAPKSRFEQEIAGYRDALVLIHESAAHMTFNEGAALQPHSMMHRYKPLPGGR